MLDELEKSGKDLVLNWEPRFVHTRRLRLVLLIFLQNAGPSKYQCYPFEHPRTWCQPGWYSSHVDKVGCV